MCQHRFLLSIVYGLTVIGVLMGSPKAFAAEPVKTTATAKTMAQSAADAIKQSLALGTKKLKEEYLVTQAKSFMGAAKYDQVVSIANHILSKVDPNSTKAKELLATAQAKLKEKANAMMGEAKNKLGSFMK